jgi:hypothetical protein
VSGGAPEIEIIRLWIQDGRSRQIDSLAPADIGKAPHRRRLLLCAIIDGIIYLERSVAPTVREPMGRHLVEVYALDTLFADNGMGASTASASRIAAALALNERTVRRLRDLLTEVRLLGREQRLGLADLHWPIIPRTLANSRMSKVWWLDATSEPHPGTPDTYRCPGLDQVTPDVSGGDPGHQGGGTPDTKSGYPGHEAYTSHRDINGLAHQSLLRRLSLEERESGAAALSLSSSERLAHEVEAWSRQRRNPTAEERKRVAAMAREVRQQETQRQAARDPDAAARAAAANEALRVRSGMTSQQLEEALASLQRMQGGRE